MKKKILIIFLILFIMISPIIGWDLFVEIELTYNGLEFVIPLFCKREVTTLSQKDFFDDEKLEKMYLSKLQSKRVLKKIENNNNWIKGPIDEELIELMRRYSREGIYEKIPNIENKYWIFTNRSHGVKDKHSVEAIMNDLYYAISFGVYDIDNNILYYYQFDC